MNPFSKTKLFQHLDHLAAWQQGKVMPPVVVELDLTNLCNHGCPGCVYSHLVNVSKDSIPMDLAEQIIHQLADYGVKAVTFTGGGEPLVYGQDKVLMLMKLAKRQGMQVALITNGALLTDPEFLDLCEWIRVSLDGYNAETFARFHGRSEGEFDKVCGRLRALCEHAAVMKASGEPCATVSAGFLTMPGEYKDIRPMARFCREQFPGLDFLSFRPLVVNMVDDPALTGGGWGRSRLDQYAEHGQLDLELIETAVECARSEAAPLTVFWAEDKYRALHAEGFGKTYSKCHAHFIETTVAADCGVYFCCHTQGQERFCLGNLRERSFKEIWESDRANQIRESFDPRTTCPPACRLHQYNNMLEEISHPVTHENFL
jgi:MoaA/NifB/PqqE/SkfB family radical SAM enzyme